jgi:esterase
MELAFQLWPSDVGSRPELTESNSPPPSPPARIALLHGMGGTGALWRPIAASLENHYSIMAFDQRGHGKSRIAESGEITESGESGVETPTGYTPLDYGRDVIETLTKQKFHPTWLIGHSMGVRTACAAAYLKPDFVKGLILVDLGFSGAAGGGLGEGLAQFLRLLPPSFPSREAARAFMSEHCPDPSIAQYLMAVSVRASDGSLTFPFDAQALIQTVEATKRISVGAWVRELAQNGMPILVLRGATSLVWSHEDYEKERQSLSDCPSVEFQEFEGAGHGLPFEQRARFVSAVERFIAK